MQPVDVVGVIADSPHIKFAISPEADARTFLVLAGYALDPTRRRKCCTMRAVRCSTANCANTLGGRPQSVGEVGHCAMKPNVLSGGGFSHDKRDAAGPYLGDNLAWGAPSLRFVRRQGSGSGWIAALLLSVECCLRRRRPGGVVRHLRAHTYWSADWDDA
jgi:hypothetical protein